MPASVLGGPSITVEIGLASNPSTAIGSTTWTDISAHWRSCQIHRGRGTEFDQFQAGTMSIVLDNRDRRFDPNYAAGPYFGNLLPMRRIRVRATWNAVTYPLWSGFVDDWPQSYVANKEATVTLQCTDGFGVLALYTLPDSVWQRTIADSSPALWWRLGEQSGTTAIDASGNGRIGTYLGGATFNTRTGLIVNSSDNGIGFDGVDDAVIGTFIPGQPFTVEAWFNLDASVTANGDYYVWLFTSSSSLYYAARVTVFGGVYTIRFVYLNTIIASLTGSAGQTFHIAFTSDGANDIAYVNGSSIGTLASPGTFAGASQFNIGYGALFGPPFKGIIDEVVVYTSVLSAPTIAAHYAAGKTPWNGDDTGARIGNVLNLAGWPSADRTLDTGATTLGNADPAQNIAIGYCQTVELTEQGQLFMGGDGTVIFRNRYWRVTNTKATASQATFGDSGTELRYATIVTDGGSQFIRNRVRAQNTGGALVEVADTTSIATYYERVDTACVGIIGTDDNQALDLASYRLAKHKDPVQRVTQLTVNPRRDPTNLWPVALGGDIGYRYTVNRRPQGVGSALTYTELAEGLDHSFDAQGNWATTFYLSAGDTQNYLILDDATYGKLDTARLGF